jgi:hypothetical protein
MKGLEKMNKYIKTLEKYNHFINNNNDKLNKKIIILDIIPKIDGLHFPIYCNMKDFFVKIQQILGISQFSLKTLRSSIVINDYEFLLGTTFGNVDELDEFFRNWNERR